MTPIGPVAIGELAIDVLKFIQSHSTIKRLNGPERSAVLIIAAAVTSPTTRKAQAVQDGLRSVFTHLQNGTYPRD